MKENNKTKLIIIGIIIISIILIALTIILVVSKNNNVIPEVNNELPEENEVIEENSLIYVVSETIESKDAEAYIRGRIHRGKIKQGDNVTIVKENGETINSEVAYVEMKDEEEENAIIGEVVLIKLKDIDINSIKKGDLLLQTNSINDYMKLEVNVDFYDATTAGRQAPYPTLYRADIVFEKISTMGVVLHPDNVEMVNPGENATFTLILNTKENISVNDEFKIKEHNREVAKGKVINIK